MEHDFYKNNCFYCKYAEINTPYSFYKDDDIEELFCYKTKKYISNPLDEHNKCFYPWFKKKEQT